MYNRLKMIDQLPPSKDKKFYPVPRTNISYSKLDTIITHGGINDLVKLINEHNLDITKNIDMNWVKNELRKKYEAKEKTTDLK